MLITFEGIDGSGKSTILNKISDKLKKDGYDILKTFEPGATTVGKKIRDILLYSSENISYNTELLLFLADRAEHINKIIKPALLDNKIVLSDRFYDSNIAYQSRTKEDLDKIINLNKIIIGCIVPNLTFFLNVDISIALSRIKLRKELDNYDLNKCEYFKKINDNYLELASREKRFVIVDANQNLDKVYLFTLHYIYSYISSHGLQKNTH